MQRILVIDDEPQITEILRASLSAHGFEVRTADDGSSGLEAFRAWQPNLVITDMAMSKTGGIAVCEAIRSSSEIPIIILSVKGEEATKVAALEAGADDYVTKPFGMDELVARVRVALRRGSIGSKPVQVFALGDFSVDLEVRRVEIEGRKVRLTPKELELLTFLLRNSGKVLTHKTLLSAIWGRTYADQSDSVRTLVRQLRSKIEPNPATPGYLKTETWVGYRFTPAWPRRSSQFSHNLPTAPPRDAG
jgi:two-component system KDP operon response regulator KdpE